MSALNMRRRERFGEYQSCCPHLSFAPIPNDEKPTPTPTPKPLLKLNPNRQYNA